MLQHGSFDIACKDKTIIVKCMGAWNIETVQEFIPIYKKYVLAFDGQPWACLLDLTQWELATPEAWELIDELNVWGNANNQRYEAVICSISFQQIFVEQSHLVMPNVEKKFCDDLAQAQQWLASVGLYPL